MRMMSLLVAGVLSATVPLVARQAVAQQSSSGSLELNRPAEADSPRPAPRGRSERPRTPIACTRTGCRPIPPGCWIEIERNWDGLPTGFDAIICPFR
jgi:hypothetical protein